MKKARAAKGGRKLTLYLSIGSQALTLLRNVLVARLLGPQEFGVAAVIILTISFLDSFSNAGPQNLLVQAKDEDGRPLLAAAHGMTLGRGFSTTALLLILAVPLSSVFGLQLGWPAIIGLAISSFISGFLHRGTRMVQRDGDFRLDAISQIAGDIAALAVAVPVAMFTHSHIAIVAGLIARSVLLVASSHLLAPQPYEVSWDRHLLSRFWAFGWPLMINGPLLFISAQADRLFISRELGATALGLYSAVMVLVTSPSTAILKWLGTIYMPPLAKVYHQTGSLQPKGIVYEYTAMMALSGLLMFTGFATLGSFAVSVLYGAKFSTPAELVALIGGLQIFRFLRAWPSTLALSVAASGGILVSTVVRLIALPIGYLGLVTVGGLPGLLIGFIVGEVLALLISLLIVNRNASRPMLMGVRSVAGFVALSVVVTFAARVAGSSLLEQAAILAVSAPVGAVLLALSVSPGESRTYARRIEAEVRKRLVGVFGSRR